MKLLTVPEASQYLRISVHTLNVWRNKKRGPEFVTKDKLIAYSKKSLDNFLEKTKG